MIWLTLLNTALLVLTIWLLWSHLQAMLAVQQALRVWDRPEHLATPAPEPGTTWAVSDREQAAGELRLIEQSQRRAEASQFRRTSRRSINPSGVRPAS